MKPLLYVAMVGVALSGCSTSQSSGPSTQAQQTPSDAGETDPLAASLCPPACVTVKRCLSNGNVDVDACRAECAKELAGQGYLNPDFAPTFFQTLGTPGEDCGTIYFAPWMDSPSQPYDAGALIKDPSIQQECDDAAKGPCSYIVSCAFTRYYIWNTQYRAALRACWDMPCDSILARAQQGDCVGGAGAPPCGYSWVGVPNPNFFFAVSNCDGSSPWPPDAGTE